MVLAISVVLTILFSSPDEKPTTIQSWSRTDPVDFVTTATTELDGSSGSGELRSAVQQRERQRPAHRGSSILQKWLGVSHPVNTAQDFVLAPLRAIPGQPGAAERGQRLPERVGQPADHVDDARTRRRCGKAKRHLQRRDHRAGRQLRPAVDMMPSLLNFAQSGGLDGALLTSKQFYNTDYTKPLLFLADGAAARRTAPRPSTCSASSGG